MIRLTCYRCGKSVSGLIPPDIVVRGAVICPECIEALEAANKGVIDRWLDPVKETK